jgi:hypothetical protein
MRPEEQQEAQFHSELPRLLAVLTELEVDQIYSRVTAAPLATDSLGKSARDHPPAPATLLLFTIGVQLLAGDVFDLRSTTPPPLLASPVPPDVEQSLRDRPCPEFDRSGASFFDFLSDAVFLLNLRHCARQLLAPFLDDAANVCLRDLTYAHSIRVVHQLHILFQAVRAKALSGVYYGLEVGNLLVSRNAAAEAEQTANQAQQRLTETEAAFEQRVKIAAETQREVRRIRGQCDHERQKRANLAAAIADEDSRRQAALDDEAATTQAADELAKEIASLQSVLQHDPARLLSTIKHNVEVMQRAKADAAQVKARIASVAAATQDLDLTREAVLAVLEAVSCAHETSAHERAELARQLQRLDAAQAHAGDDEEQRRVLLADRDARLEQLHSRTREADAEAARARRDAAEAVATVQHSTRAASDAEQDLQAAIKDVQGRIAAERARAESEAVQHRQRIDRLAELHHRVIQRHQEVTAVFKASYARCPALRQRALDLEEEEAAARPQHQRQSTDLLGRSA